MTTPTPEAVSREELRVLLERATPRPWSTDYPTEIIAVLEGGAVIVVAQMNPLAELIHQAAEANARLIVAAVNALPGLLHRIEELEGENRRLDALLNTPELHDFASAVVLEAAHQRERWGSSHDAGKEASDWFWLVGYLAGKALNANTAGNVDKARHHTISTAAALANWHAAITGEHTAMRPGIDPVARGLTDTAEDRAGCLAAALSPEPGQ